MDCNHRAQSPEPDVELQLHPHQHSDDGEHVHQRILGQPRQPQQHGRLILRRGRPVPNDHQQNIFQIGPYPREEDDDDGEQFGVPVPGVVDALDEGEVVDVVPRFDRVQVEVVARVGGIRGKRGCIGVGFVVGRRGSIIFVRYGQAGAYSKVLDAGRVALLAFRSQAIGRAEIRETHRITPIRAASGSVGEERKVSYTSRYESSVTIKEQGIPHYPLRNNTIVCRLLTKCKCIRSSRCTWE